MPQRVIRAKKILTVVAVTFVANVSTAITKIVVGSALGLLALTASGFESLLDSANNVVGFVGIRLSAREADSEHPYGHRKFETFVALIIAFMMLLAGTQIFVQGVDSLKRASVPEVTSVAFAVIVVSTLISLLVSFAEGRFGRLYKSEFLLADSRHTLIDFFSSAMVLASTYLVSVGHYWADFASAAVIVIIILVLGFRIIKDAFTILVDTARIKPSILEFACLQVDGVKAVHKIRSRGTSDAINVDLHIKVRRDLPLEEAHKLSHRVKDKLMRDFPEIDDVVVHVEPWYGK